MFKQRDSSRSAMTLGFEGDGEFYSGGKKEISSQVCFCSAEHPGYHRNPPTHAWPPLLWPLMTPVYYTIWRDCQQSCPWDSGECGLL